MQITKSYLKDLTYKVNGVAIEVHKQLGPGLLESTYHKCMKFELSFQGLKYTSEMSVPINYKGHNVKANLKCDLFIENILPIELKSVAAILPIHEAQIFTYMKLLNVPKGILYNFNVNNLYNNGQKTYVNRMFRNLKD